MKMFRSLLILPLFVSSTFAATIVDSWTFGQADGTDLAGVLSNNGTALGNNSGGLVTTQGGELEFTSDWNGATGSASTFRTTNLDTDPITSGLVQVQFTVTSAGFTATDAVDGSGNVWFGLRDTNPSNNEFARGRLRYEGGPNQFVIQGNGNTALATFSGNSLSDLTIRYVVDLDNQTALDSYQLFYTIGINPEVQVLSTQLDPTGGLQIDDFRLAQQITNGGTDWRAGDTMTIDNLSVSIIPEPSAAFFGGLGMLCLLRRRR